MVASIVILHGWGRRLERWQGLKKELIKAGFNVFLPHLPGFGSRPAPEKPWKLDDYVRWVKSRLPKNYFLIGHSFGGRIAIKIASQNPQGMKGLILIDSAGIRPGNWLKRSFFWLLAKMGKIFFLLPPFFLLRGLAKPLLYKLAGARDYEQAKGVMKKTLQKVIAEDLKKDLKKIKIPTLILWGEQDKVTPVSDGKLMDCLIKNSYLKIFPGVGHDLPLRMFNRAAEIMIKFCQENS